MKYPITNRYGDGFTLVELMVAMVIGLVLMGGVVQIFAGSKQAYRTQEELSRTQESARFAMEALLKDIRMAGYMGCFGQTAVNDIVKPALKPVSGDFFDDPVVGYDGQSSSGTALTDWSPNLPSYFSAGDVVAGSDVLVIQRVSPFSPSLIGNLAPSNANIQIDTNPNNEIAAGDILMLSDCRDTDIFMANNVSSGGGKVTIAHSNSVNTDNKLSKVYQADARLMRLIMNGYFIGTNTDGNTALFRTSISTNGSMGTPVELVEGVETMQLSYGEDTSGDGLPNRYVVAGDITDTDDIVSIRIGLLMYSTDTNVAPSTDTKTYNIAGTDVSNSGTTPTHGADKSLRQPYTATIKIRNRGMQ